MFRDNLERRALLIVLAGYPLLWAMCWSEIRYWRWGQEATASVASREVTLGTGDRPRKFTTLEISFTDVGNGEVRQETLQYATPTLEAEQMKEVEVQYIPLVPRTARLKSLLGRYFVVFFLGINALFGLVLLWGWNLARQDTWARSDTRRR